MSDALTRSAKLLSGRFYDALHTRERCGLTREQYVEKYWPCSKDRARAAILAFLSGEDVVGAIARTLACKLSPAYADATIWAEDRDMWLRREQRGQGPFVEAKAALAALRALAQEDQRS